MPETVSRVLDAIGREPWLIAPGAMEQIVAIASRLNESPEAVATRLGRPLDNTRRVTLHGATALIPIQGPIFRYANLFTEVSGATSLQVLATDFQEALDNPAVRRIVLSIDSPGGQSSGIAEFADLVAAATAQKPVIAYAGDLAASAAYWIGAHASELVVSPTALLGSIGVVMSYRPPDAKDAPLEIVSTQSPLKRATPDTESGRAEAQRLVDELAAVFVSRIATARKTTEAKVLADFGRGSLLIGAAAVAAGMADRVGSLNSLLTAGATGPTPPKVITMKSEESTGAPTVDRAFLAANQPALLAELLAEGQALGLSSGRLEGAAQERERIQGVRAQLIPGHEVMIEGLAFDGKTTGPEAAVAVLAAERSLRLAAQQAIAAAPPPVAAAAPPAPDAPVDLSAARRKLFNQVSGAKA
jgi:capsid assembly protease